MTAIFRRTVSLVLNAELCIDAHLIAEKRLQAEHSLMIGDRKHDLIGAHRNGLQAVGVGYGFGSHAELMAELPAYYYYYYYATLPALRAAFS